MGSGVTRVIALAVLSLVLAAPAQASFFGPGPWNTALPANPALDANSTPIVTTMSTKISLAAQQGSQPYINTTAYSVPIWPASTSVQPLVFDNDPNKTISKAIADLNATGGLPIPAGAQPADGTDGHIVIYDAPGHKLYEFWRASSPEANRVGCTTPLDWGVPCKGDGRWHADYGGMMDNVDTDPGYFSPNAWPTAGSTGWGWGARATSLPLVGGLITFDDLRAGVIDHAVAASFKELCSGYFMAPAQRKDGSDASPACLPEGAKLQLDPTYNVDADTNPPLTKAVEKAAQKYGIVMVDGGGASIQFYGQDPQTEPSNPYTSGPGLGGLPNGNKGFFGGKQAYQLFQGFPWSRLRVIASTHCTAAPCQ